MAQFILKIELGNDAMHTKGDLIRALEEVQDKIRKNYATIHGMKNDCKRIMDVNGNCVGYFEVK